eukprot:m.92449 g.92449  ORF g.92449 m.92449 type:complete len:88 (+) comp12037_c0_seq2:454-717(+)
MVDEPTDLPVRLSLGAAKSLLRLGYCDVASSFMSLFLVQGSFFTFCALNLASAGGLRHDEDRAAGDDHSWPSAQESSALSMGGYKSR